MNRLRRLLPDALAGRIVLLLAIALLVANAIALVVLNFEQRRFGRQATEDRVIERVVDLISAMEAVDARARRVIAREASSRFARVRVGKTPLLREIGTDTRSQYIAARLAETLKRDDVTVGTIERPHRAGASDRRHGGRTGGFIGITAPLVAQGGQAQWLNVVISGAPPRPRHVDGKSILIVLALSLLCVLGVAIAVARLLTKPLGRLSHAAEAAGRGDRTARVPEEGPREMRDAARAFNAMQAEISQFDAERMRMFAAVGHDLRTPMTSLRIRAEMVDDSDLRDAMVRTLDAMTVMADGLVRYAKEGRDAEEVKPVELGALIRHLCDDRAVTFSADAKVQVTGRPVALGRAIGNLIDNAIRYGGEATVTLSQDARHAIVTIEDTGPGIPTDHLDAMFQPFTRGDDSRNLDTGGAGLGLSIARTTIIAHGGQIMLENRVEGGLRATVTLPLQRSA
ncbi:ATP-binding protein [Roseovarius sp. M141]|uniref:ATP-binding protein n=1 Tax=Roseovarius sp. M141 TaxID=2583806 RepID=UPI0020CC7A40|nr:ATP-binding protein [Roseovarius sp. M141]